MPEIIVVGEALIDLYAEPGHGLSDATTFMPRIGGAPANLAVAAARLGNEVGFVGRVGEDGFGDRIAATLIGCGVDVSCLIRDEVHPTMVACVALPEPHRPDFLLMSGANAALVPSDIPSAYLGNALVLAFGSVTLAFDSRQAALDAARRARDAGAHVLFDVNYRSNIWRSDILARNSIFEAIDIASVVKLNAEECTYLFGRIEVDDAAAKILARGVSLVCISMGADGARLYSNSTAAIHCGFEVDVVDTTGSGDAFLAAIASSLCDVTVSIDDLTKDDLKRIATFANACGAFAATRVGAMEADFSRADIEALQSGSKRDG